eukprot:485683-Pyramimonas_sp.AAC.2
MHAVNFGKHLGTGRNETASPGRNRLHTSNPFTRHLFGTRGRVSRGSGCNMLLVQPYRPP